MEWWNIFLELVYPCECVICGKEKVFLCEVCRQSLRLVDQKCGECGEESEGGWTHKECRKKLSLDGLSVIWDYEDEKVRKIIKEIKFEFNRELLRELVRGCDFKIEGKWDFLVPVPLFWQRKNWRGFNQAEILAEEVGEKLDLEVKDVLRRSKKTEQQAKIKGKINRIKNVKGVFEIKEGMDLKGKKVLLVDDVFTSGATMKEVGKKLKKAGVKKVWGVCLAG